MVTCGPFWDNCKEVLTGEYHVDDDVETTEVVPVV
jgi:hypothetical protein